MNRKKLTSSLLSAVMVLNSSVLTFSAFITSVSAKLENNPNEEKIVQEMDENGNPTYTVNGDVLLNTPLKFTEGINTLVLKGNLTIALGEEQAGIMVSTGAGLTITGSGKIQVSSANDTSTKAVNNSGTLTIDGNGIVIEALYTGAAISGKNPKTYSIYNDRGTLYFKNGTTKESRYGIYTNSETKITGGNVNGKTIGVYTNGNTTTIENGEIYGVSGIRVQKGTVQVTGGNISGSTDGVYNAGGTFNLNGGEVSAPGAYGISCFENTITNINSGTVTGGMGLTTQGDSAGVTVNINGGTIEGTISAGIYFASGEQATYGEGKSIYTISGGTIKGAAGGVVIRAGELNIKDGTFISTGDTAYSVGDAKNTNGQKYPIPPVALVCDVNSAAASYTSPVVTITGGSFSSGYISPEGDKIPSAVSTANGIPCPSETKAPGNDKKETTLIISGGSFDTSEIYVPVNSTTNSKYVQTYQINENSAGIKYTVSKSEPEVIENSILIYSTGESEILYYAVKLDPTGGSVTPELKWANAVSDLPEPVRSGYTFTGWTDKDGNPVSADSAIEQAQTLYAAWKKNPSDNGQTTPNNPSAPSTPKPPADEAGNNNGTIGSGPAFTEPGTVTKPNSDGSSTTYTQDEDGTKSATTVDSDGVVTDVQVTIPDKVISDGIVSVDLGKNTQGQIIKIPGNVSDENKAPEISINLPSDANETTVEFELRENTGKPGTVAMVEDENGNLVPIVDSIAIGDSFYVPVNGGKTQIVVKDNSKSFTDVSSNQWYDDAVAFVSARGIMNGSAGEGSATFAPNEPLTRAMLAQMIANMEGQPNTSVTTNPWYAGAQDYVVSKGLMGVGSPFNPDAPISRQDLAVVLWRNAGSPSVSTSVLNEYKDRNGVSNYAIQAVAWAVENGILGVNSPLNPASDASRAEIARMFMAYIIDQASK